MLPYALTLAVYVAALAPTLYWLDSSELAAAAWQLGVAHPPGQPLALLVGKLVAFVPLGTVAFRVGLASAVAQAGTAALVAALARRLVASTRPTMSTPATTLLALAAALLYGLSYSAAMQAVRPEVYALSTLLVVGAALLATDGITTPSETALRRAAFVAGLGLTNHHLLTLAIAVPLFFVLVRPWRRAFAAALAVLLALAVYAYLPIRAARHPVIDWGAPTTLARFWWTVTAQAFQKSVGRATTSDPSLVLGALAAELALVGLFAAALGLYALRTQRRLALVLGAAVVLTALAPAMVGFDEANPDAYGYLSGAIALAAALAAAGVALVAARGAPVIAGLACVGALATLSGAPRYTLTRHTAPEELASYLDTAPPRALVVTSYFQTIFALDYLQEIEGRRPDVRLVHRHFLRYPGYRDELTARWPDLAPALSDGDVGSPLPGAVVEYDLDLPAALVAQSSLPPAPLSEEPQAKRFAAWMRFLAVHRACRLGEPALIAAAKDAAAPLLASDEEYRRLLLRCANADTVEKP